MAWAKGQAKSAGPGSQIGGNRWPWAPGGLGGRSSELRGRVLLLAASPLVSTECQCSVFYVMCPSATECSPPQKGNLPACSASAALPAEGDCAPRGRRGAGHCERGARIGCGAGRRRDCGGPAVEITLRLRQPIPALERRVVSLQRSLRASHPKPDYVGGEQGETLGHLSPLGLHLPGQCGILACLRTQGTHIGDSAGTWASWSHPVGVGREEKSCLRLGPLFQNPPAPASSESRWVGQLLSCRSPSSSPTPILVPTSPPFPSLLFLVPSSSSSPYSHLIWSFPFDPPRFSFLYSAPMFASSPSPLILASRLQPDCAPFILMLSLKLL